MRQYDSIPFGNAKTFGSGPWMVFDKLDGSNLRVEVHTKKGNFTKWGSRKVLMDVSNEANILTKAVGIFESHYEAATILQYLRTFSKNSLFTLYFEFVGLQSFAGQHEEDDTHELRLLDIWEEKRGFIPSSDLTRAFPLFVPNSLGTIFELGAEFLAAVQGGTLEGMGMEGVILKHPNLRTYNSKNPRMMKIKRSDWIQKVQAKHKNDWQEYI